ncbi:CBS domain-containing protein [Tepidanaerobacter acetatoxydans]|uniref:CBS domain-containing protein n=1 Tax=Tepidanaerobacter acetatoxydans TaxID=499229 RepID=UPI001BD39D38|nr:CBS domain-containing protein [Tepidanaerobacter acetatoxydans]
MKIREVMKSPVIVIRPDETVDRALDIMNQEKVNGTPIVDENNRLVGMIVKADIYRFLMDPGHYKSCPVEWVMTKEVIKAHADEEILDVAKRLRDCNIIALPVVEGDDEVVGIISFEDILDYYIEQQMNKY